MAGRGRSLRARGAAAVAALLAAAMVAGCGGAADGAISGGGGGDGGTPLTLVSYSTPQAVYDEVIPEYRHTAAGHDVSIATSFGPSGDQSRAVNAGLRADVVSFSLEPDLDRLVRHGLVAPTWRDTRTGGLVSRSVVVFVVRRGNPQGVHAWRDLLRPGLQVVTPSPATSGSAKWNVLAAYGAAGGARGDRPAGEAFVRELLEHHVAVQPKSAREALQSFASGTGDVLLSYENEAVTARRKGVGVDYVVPDATILIENPIAALKRSASPRQAQALVDYLLSRPAQEHFAAWGYRPVDDAVAAEHARTFPRPPHLFTIRDLGGWPAVDDAFFDAEHGWVTRLQEHAGGR